MAGTATAYNEGRHRLFEIDAVAETIKLILCMTNTTADTENDGMAIVGDLGTLDEHDGTNYARQTLSGKSITKEDANDRSVFKASDITITALGAGTRDVDGFILYWDDAGTERLISYHKYEVARIADGSDFVIEFRADTGLWLVQ